MNITKLSKTIELHLKKGETTFLDFKKIWHEDNKKLVHDILCLANCDHDGDRYLIFGIDDDKKITGITDEDQNRKNNENLQNLIQGYNINRSIKFSLQTIEFCNVNLDCIVISKENIPNRPFYSQLHGKKTKELTGKIFTRNGSTNTPMNQTANIHQIETLWRSFFKIDQTGKEKIFDLMRNYDDWIRKKNSKKITYYHKIYPEYKVLLEDPDLEAYCPMGYLIMNHTYKSNNGRCEQDKCMAKMYYNDTLLEEKIYIRNSTTACHLISLPANIENDKVTMNNEEYFYYFFIKDSEGGILLNFLQRGEIDFSVMRNSRMKLPIILFENTQEQEKFCNYLKDNHPTINQEYVKLIKKRLQSAHNETREEMEQSAIISNIFNEEFKLLN